MKGKADVRLFRNNKVHRVSLLMSGGDSLLISSGLLSDPCCGPRHNNGAGQENLLTHRQSHHRTRIAEHVWTYAELGIACFIA